MTNYFINQEPAFDVVCNLWKECFGEWQHGGTCSTFKHANTDIDINTVQVLVQLRCFAKSNAHLPPRSIVYIHRYIYVMHICNVPPPTEP